MKKYALPLLMTACCLLIACNDIFVQPVRDTGNGTLRIIFTGANGRTIFPSTEFDHYVYTFTKTGGGTMELEPDENNYFSVPVGNWQVDVAAYTGDVYYYNLAATGTGSFTISSGTTVNVEITLAAQNEDSGYGTFTYNVSFPAETTVQQFTLEKFPYMSTVTLYPDWTDTSRNGTSELGAGYYLFNIKLKNGTRHAGISEVVHIYKLATSEYEKTFNEIDFSRNKIIIMEGFENNSTSLPYGWNQEYFEGTIDWAVVASGTGTPNTVHGGTYKARMYNYSTTSQKTKLLMPSLNLIGLTNPTLSFWHTQQYNYGQDNLRIYYKASAYDTWTLLEEYTSNVNAWTERTIPLPYPSSDYYIAFEGEAAYGYGIQLDDITIFDDN